MLMALINWGRVRLVLGAAALVAIGSLYAWGKVQQSQKREAIAIAADAQVKLKAAYDQVAELRISMQALDTALTIRDKEHYETEELLRSASAELNRLRRQNAELREWLDRPIPADVVRLLSNATRDPSGKAVPSGGAAR